jgi:hypothetical protein
MQRGVGVVVGVVAETFVLIPLFNSVGPCAQDQRMLAEFAVSLTRKKFYSQEHNI